jgi:hypothetical protein
MLIPFNNLFAFIKLKCLECTIDESHAIKHSMDVFNYAHKIFEVEKINHCEIIGQERIIYTAALLHDMCDDKYTDVEQGLQEIKGLLTTNNYAINEIDIINTIISTMSYSKVKKNGFPDINSEYQLSYHIVREADLLTAYDIERCMVYGINKRDMDYTETFAAASYLYSIRMEKHIEDGLFTTQFALEEGKKLNEINKKRINEIQEIIEKFDIKDNKIFDLCNSNI